jgi:hypothetical protein
MDGQRPLPGNSCVKRLVGSQEHSEERVSFGPDLDAVGVSNCSAQNPSMVILNPLVDLVTQLL